MQEQIKINIIFKNDAIYRSQIYCYTKEKNYFMNSVAVFTSDYKFGACDSISVVWQVA